MSETTIHPALDEFDAAMRQIRSRLAALVDKNERLTQSVEAIHEGVGRQLGETQRECADLTAEANALRRETTRLAGENAEFRTEIQSLNEARRVLTAELAEARKQSVALLPEITDKILEDANREWYDTSYGLGYGEKARAYNIVLARHFRESAEARVKPVVDVEAVIKAVYERFQSPPFLDMDMAIREVLPEFVTDAPAPAKPTLTAKHFSSDGVTVTASGITLNDGTLTFGPDETLAAAVKRVERETRAKCAAMVRREVQLAKSATCSGVNNMMLVDLADAMERGE